MPELSQPSRVLGAGATVALVGNPNCGKTALFNLLTGSRQKVANYAGVTVERKEGTRQAGQRHAACSVLDLPGTYSLTPTTPDERITRDVVDGSAPARRARPHRLRGRCHQPAPEPAPGAGAQAPRPADGGGAQHDRRGAGQARHDDRHPARSRASSAAGGARPSACATAATRALLRAARPRTPADRQREPAAAAGAATPPRTQREVRRILAAAGAATRCTTARLQRPHRRVVLHPVWGLVLLAVMLFLIFQAVFSWADVPMDAIKAGDGGARRLRSTRRWPTARCAACWSTA